MRSVRRFAEGIFVTALLFFLSEAVRYLLLNPRGEGSRVFADDPFRRPAYALIYFTVLVGLLTHRRAVVDAMRASWFLWLLTALALASTYWSVNSAVTLRAAMGITVTGLLGVLFDLRYTVKEQLRILGVVLTLVVLASIAFAVIPPSLGIEQTLHAGAWRGAFPQKNALGRAMALAVPVYALLLIESRRAAPFVLCGLLLAVALAGLSQSATAPVVIVALLFLAPVVSALRSRRFSVATVTTAAMVAAGIVGVLVYANSEEVLAALGRDATLSGRPLLWLAILPEISTRPLLGFGLSAFWNGGTGASATVEAVVQWAPVHAHNGFIDVVLDLGIVGLSLLLLGFTIAVRRALLRLQEDLPWSEAAWPLAFLVFFFLSNMSESSILKPFAIYWFLYASVLTRLMRTV